MEFVFFSVFLWACHTKVLAFHYSWGFPGSFNADFWIHYYVFCRPFQQERKNRIEMFVDQCILMYPSLESSLYVHCVLAHSRPSIHPVTLSTDQLEMTIIMADQCLLHRWRIFDVCCWRLHIWAQQARTGWHCMLSLFKGSVSLLKYHTLYRGWKRRIKTTRLAWKMKQTNRLRETII